MSSHHNAVSTEGEVKQYPSLPTTVKGILFDMDGTLTDSDILHFEAYRETFLKVKVYFLFSWLMRRVAGASACSLKAKGAPTISGRTPAYGILAQLCNYVEDFIKISGLCA